MRRNYSFWDFSGDRTRTLCLRVWDFSAGRTRTLCLRVHPVYGPCVCIRGVPGWWWPIPADVTSTAEAARLALRAAHDAGIIGDWEERGRSWDR